MASETASLDEACELIVDCPHSTPVWTDSGEVVLRNENIKNGRLDLSSPSYTDTRHFADRVRRAVPQAGDLVFTREAPMGEVCMIPPGLRCCLGQRQVLLRPSARFDGHYLLYAIQSPVVQQQIRWNEGTGSTVSNVRIPILKSLRVPAPAKHEQSRTATVLKSLDDRIDHNRALAANLEAIASALFKSWFVDFDPVRAKAAGETPPDLASDLAALFPDRFVDSELGEIPKGWAYRRLDQLADVAIGRTPPRKEPHWFSKPPAGSRWASIRDMGEAGMFISETSESITSEGIERFNMRLAPARAVLFSFKMTMGRVSIVAEPMATNEAIAQIIPKIGTYSEAFMYFAMKFCRDLSGESTSSISTAVNSKQIKELQIISPSPSVLKAYSEIAAPIVGRALVCHHEKRSLIQLRDLLLPRLISGKLRVEDAEAALVSA